MLIVEKGSIVTAACLGISILLSFPAHAGSEKENRKSASFRQAKEETRAVFIKFVVDFFRWSAKAYGKLENGEAKEEIFFKFTNEEFKRLQEFFETSRPILYEIGRQNDLFQVKGQELIPQEIYSFLKLNFGLKNVAEPLDVNLILQRMVGCGSAAQRGPGGQGRGGFLDKIAEINLSEWTPIKTFINQFKDTLTLDTRVANNLGRVLLPLLKHYFNYMDVISRLRLFKELIEDWQNLDIQGDRHHDLEVVAIKIFQNTGPILIKFLQQLQEEIVGETPISKTLEGLKRSRAMHPATAEQLVRQEFSSIYGIRKLHRFSFTPEPLGIASIAQTHKFTYENQVYVIKILKDRVQEVFGREVQILHRLLSDEKNSDDFDKGLKQTIANMIAGIGEEMDFANEMANINQAHVVYANPSRGIQTIAVPDLRPLKEASRPIKTINNAALIMNLAPGEPLGKLLKHGGEGELQIAYTLVQNLYRDYLSKALGGVGGVNFYHGDLHRENIFIDLHPSIGRPMLTLIDFGNAGIINPEIRSSIIEILLNTRDTNQKLEWQINRYIERLGHYLHKFILATSVSKGADGISNKILVNEFFMSCFNPNGSVEQKMLASQAVSDKKDELLALRKRLNEEIVLQPSKAKELKPQLGEVQDTMDFTNALLGNCLNGATNRLLTTLAEPNSVSEKLIVVFQELARNGISLPKEIIFFNKSKALLEGILTNIAQKLDALKASYVYVEPEDIFDEVLKHIKR